MTPFEDELKKALRSVEPPDGFTERLAARMAALPAREHKSTHWGWLSVAAALIVMVGGFGIQQEHEREVKGEAAKQKLLIAIRITTSKLQQAEQQVQRVERTGVSE